VTNLKRLLLAAFMATAFVGMAVAASLEEQILERIHPVGNVCVAGQDCGEGGGAAAATAAATGEPRGGEEVYTAACSACHSTGAAGAPKLGDASAWAPRIEKGQETLVQHAINGFNAMPPMGGCGACSEEEIANAVEHIVANSQ
jgi:cytochrome c5